MRSRVVGYLLAALATTLLACEGPTGPAGQNGTNGTDGTSCTVVDNEDGTKTITCEDGTSVTVADGTNGTDGTDCTVVDNGDGTKTITCTDGTTVTVSDGTSCTVTDNGDGTQTITCEDGTTVVVSDGTPGTSCTVVDNGDGTKTITCTDGTSVTVLDGEDGLPGGNSEILNFHSAPMLAAAELEEANKYHATATITSATADLAGVVTVHFTVEDPDGDPVTALAGFSATIAKLVPASGGVSYSRWVPYIYRTQTVSTTGDWPAPVGTSAQQAYRENSGTLTNLGAGSYSYVFATNLTTTATTYERNRTHRVSIMMGGHNGPTADANFDFVPDASALTLTRDIVPTSVCQNCHGWQFDGHGGDRLTVENCVTCHDETSFDPQGADGAGFPGESLDMKVMIHKIHAGGELATVPGLDGIVWDNPETTVDESADNGHYAIWGHGNTRMEWWHAGFPAVLENCNACHQGTGAQVDNWKAVPSRLACGSCHDDVDFAAGTGHITQTSDAACAGCHPATGSALAVTEAHAWQTKDPRNIPEFTAAITVGTPANGSYFVAGESPVITLVLTDVTTGAIINHNIAQDASAEGCLESGCPAGDGLFRSANLFVSGPRGRRVPVLTTAARAQILSSSTGPFDLSAASATLVVKIDGGETLPTIVDAEGLVVPATFTVPVSSGTFGNLTAATTDEIVAWLNADPELSLRAIAFNQGGKVGLRSRNLGKVHAIQLQASAVATAVFAGDLGIKTPTGSSPSNAVFARTDPTLNDPKAVRSAGAITYYLDPVDDLEPGTYIVSIEFADRGRVTITNYKTPTVARGYFQVKTAAEEPQVASNCDSCHGSPTGVFVLDFPRHNKPFDYEAIDGCAACHDYQPQYGTGAGWTGSRPISKRVHAVHNGSNNVYPVATVEHEETVPGRDWRLVFPQDIRNCETCHPAESSGTWVTKPSRVPCAGCHDSDGATAHMRTQTFDPTPLDAFSGDEQEACTACH